MNILNGQISTYFNIFKDRLHCRCGCMRFYLDEHVIAHYSRLSEVRGFAGVSFRVNGGQRCWLHHQRIYYINYPGKPVPRTSGHLIEKKEKELGVATDVNVAIANRNVFFVNSVIDKWQELCRRDGISGAGSAYYKGNGFIHFDSKDRPAGPWVVRYE